MHHRDQDDRPAPFGTPEEEVERSGRLPLHAADDPPAEWEDEWVDLGGEG